MDEWIGWTFEPIPKTRFTNFLNDTYPNVSHYRLEKYNTRLHILKFYLRELNLFQEGGLIRGSLPEHATFVSSYSVSSILVRVFSDWKSDATTKLVALAAPAATVPAAGSPEMARSSASEISGPVLGVIETLRKKTRFPSDSVSRAVDHMPRTIIFSK